MISNFITNKDFSGPLADLIKIINFYKDEDVPFIINNVIKNNNKKEIVKKINRYYGKCEEEKKKKEEEERRKRAELFGIGN